VAGTSVEALLRPHMDDKDILPAVTPRDEFYSASKGAFSRNYLVNRDEEVEYTRLVLNGNFDEAAAFLQRCQRRASSHMNYSQILQLLNRCGYDISDFFVFTIERHPYDWLLSNILYDNSSYNRSGNAMSKRCLEDLNESAKRFLLRPDIKKKLNWGMYSKDGHILVDHVIKYESLKEELEVVLKRIIPECDISHMPALKQNKAGIGEISPFSREIKALAQEVFSPVFRVFDYES